MEKRVEILRPAHRRRLVTDHRRVAHGAVLVICRHARMVVIRVIVAAGGCGAIEGEPPDHGNGRERRRSGEQLSSRETRFSHD
jgi:hypothetical protein